VYAAVVAHRKKNNLVVQGGSIQLVKEGTLFAPLHGSGFEVVAEDGTPIQPTGSFYISVETFDPVHLIIDWFQPKVSEREVRDE
jgi:hypothetical protein